MKGSEKTGLKSLLLYIYSINLDLSVQKQIPFSSMGLVPDRNRIGGSTLVALVHKHMVRDDEEGLFFSVEATCLL